MTFCPTLKGHIELNSQEYKRKICSSHIHTGLYEGINYLTTAGTRWTPHNYFIHNSSSMHLYNHCICSTVENVATNNVWVWASSRGACCVVHGFWADISLRFMRILRVYTVASVVAEYLFGLSPVANSHPFNFEKYIRYTWNISRVNGYHGSQLGVFAGQYPRLGWLAVNYQ